MKEYLIDLLSKYLYRRDFFFEKKSYRFTRREKERSCSIRLVFVRNTQVFICYEIRFNLIEKLIDAFDDQKGSPLHSTIFINTGDLLVETELYKFPIDNLETIQESAENIITLIETFAFKYFDEYQTLADLHHLLNEIPFKAMKIRNDKYHNETLSGFFRGILTARLLSKNIHDLVQEHLKHLDDNNYDSENIEHYIKFAEWVEKLDVDKIPARIG